MRRETPATASRTGTHTDTHTLANTHSFLLSSSSLPPRFLLASSPLFLHSLPLQLKGSGGGSGSGSGVGETGSNGGESKAGQGEGAGAAGCADGAGGAVGGGGSNGSNDRRKNPKKLMKVTSFYEESRAGRKGSIMMKDAKGKDHLSDEAKKYV